jgi:hypothetical protein
VLQQEVGSKILRHLHVLCHVLQLGPLLLPLSDVEVHRLSSLPLRRVKELVEGFGALDDVDLLDRLERCKDVLVPLWLSQLLVVGHQVLAGFVGLTMQGVQQLLANPLFLLCQVSGFFCFIFAITLQVVDGKQHPLAVFPHQSWD